MDEERGLVQSVGASQVKIADSSCDAGRAALSSGRFLLVCLAISLPALPLILEVDADTELLLLPCSSGKSHIPSERPHFHNKQFVDHFLSMESSLTVYYRPYLGRVV